MKFERTVEGKLRLFGENLDAPEALAKNIAKSINRFSVESRKDFVQIIGRSGRKLLIYKTYSFSTAQSRYMRLFGCSWKLASYGIIYKPSKVRSIITIT
jgi:hypothetical protein